MFEGTQEGLQKLGNVVKRYAPDTKSKESK